MERNQRNIGAWTLGLDIGIASVGWAAMGDKRLIDLGVRAFDKAETELGAVAPPTSKRISRCENLNSPTHR